MPPLILVLFPTTDWSEVLKAGLDSPVGREALESVCGRYRPPVVSYLHSLPLPIWIAEDVTQEWFVYMISHPEMFEPGRIQGSFGAYVRRCAINQLKRWFRSDSAAKRGGGVDLEPFESNPRLLMEDALAEDTLFDELCARHHLVLAEAMVERAWRLRGHARQWEAMHGLATGELTLDEVRLTLNIPKGTAYDQRARLRKEIKEALAALDSATPGDPQVARWLKLLDEVRKPKPDEPPT